MSKLAEITEISFSSSKDIYGILQKFEEFFCLQENPPDSDSLHA
jgi:hypothetical protein